MKVRLAFLGLDFSLQAIIILLALLCLLGDLISPGNGSGFFALIGLAMTGAWQMGSVFLKTLLLGRRWQIVYLLSAVSYFFCLRAAETVDWSFLPTHFFFEEWAFWVFFPILPAVAALSYLYLSFEEFREEVERHRSDLVVCQG